MQYTGIVITKCPYCGYLNKISGERLENQRADVITCGENGGGCDRYYAIRPTLFANVEVFSMVQVQVTK